MKRILSVILCLILVLPLFGCGGAEDSRFCSASDGAHSPA
jgi:uncharacterized lipoprotein YehR (DUF1307 family)